MGGLRDPIQNPYSVCVAWLGADPRARKVLSRQQRSDFRRIARLPSAWGSKLDELGGTYEQARWVAGPAKRGLREVELRFLAVSAFLSGESRWRSWRSLRESFASAVLRDVGGWTG